MSDTTLRITGRPKIERDPSGLRKITRTYIVQGSSVTAGKVEEEVFIPYGTPDEEYDATIQQDLTNGGLTNAEVTGAYLVQQEISPGANINEAQLVRVYQELDADNEPVQIGKDQIVRGENDRMTLSRVYIVKNPHTNHYGPNRIGVDAVTVHGSELLLGSVKSEATQVYTQFTEVYYEEGVLSESVQYKFGQYPEHKLEIRTLRSIADPTPPDPNEGPGVGPWFRVSEQEGPGNRDFGQIGKTIKTIVFAKGEGLVSKHSDVKGKPPNTVEVTEIRYITGENGTVPAAEIPAFTRRTKEHKEEKDGYELHTIAGIVINNESGVVDVKVDYKHGKKPNHKLEVARAVSYGVPADSQDVLDFVYPGGDDSNLGAYVIIQEEEDTRGEFDVYTTTFARGLGEISRSSRKVGMTTVSEVTSLHPSSPVLNPDISGDELTRKVDQLDGYQKLTVSVTTEDSGVVDLKHKIEHNGALNIRTILQLGDTFDPANIPNGYAMIEDRKHRYDIYPAVTRVYAEGNGVISQGSRKVGFTSVTEKVSLHPPQPPLPTTPQSGELSRSVRQDSGHQVLTVSTTTEDSGIVDKKETEKNNGKLRLFTLTQLGDVWDASNTPAGFAEISERNHRYDIYPAITKEFAKGQGEISSSNRKVGLTVVSETTTLYPATPLRSSVIQGDELKKEISQRDGYQVEVVSTVTALSGIVDQRTDYRHQGDLTIRSATQLGSSWNSNIPGVLISERSHTYDTYPAITREYAEGDGIISESFRKVGQSIITSRISIHRDEPAIPADTLEHSLTKESGYWKLSYSIQDQGGKIVDARYEDRVFDELQYTSLTMLGDSWDATYTPFGYAEISSRNHTYNNFPAITKEFVRGIGTIRESVREDPLYLRRSFTKIYPFENIMDALVPTEAVNIQKTKKEGYSELTYELLEPHPDQSSSSNSWSSGLFSETLSELNEFPEDGLFTDGSSHSASRIEPIDSRNSRFSLTKIHAGVYKSKNKSYQKGYTTTRTESIEENSIDPDDGHCYQIADGLFRVAQTEAAQTYLSSFSNSFSSGIVRETTEEIINSADLTGNWDEGADSADGVQIHEDFGRIRKTMTSADASYTNIARSFSKFVNTTREVFISTVPQGNYADPVDLGIERVSDRLFRISEKKDARSNYPGETSISASNGGGVKVTRSKVLGDSAQNTSDFYSTDFISEKVGMVTENTTFAAAPYFEQSTRNSDFIAETTTSNIFGGDTAMAAAQLDALSDPSNTNASETEVSVRQIAPNVFKSTVRSMEKKLTDTVISTKTQFVMGGLLRTESVIVGKNPRPAAVPTGGALVSESTSAQNINGIPVTVQTTTVFIPRSHTYWTIEQRGFTFPGVAGISKHGIWHIPGHRGLLGIKTNHFITVNGTQNAIGRNYTPPVASISYTAIPMSNPAEPISETRVFTNCEIADANFPGGPQLFRGVECKDVQVTIAGENEGSTSFSGLNMGSDTEVIANHGQTQVFHIALHTSQ